MMLQSKYDIGELLYILTDKEQELRQVTSIIFSGEGIVYELSCGTSVSKHYEFELSKEVDEVLKLT